MKLVRNRTKFLELTTRRIFDFAHKIPCDERESDMYVKDKNDSYWQYKLDKGFRKVKVKPIKYFKEGFNLPEMATYTDRMLHYSGVRPHRSTLLDMLNFNKETIVEMTDLRETGGKDIVAGIARVMGDLAQDVVDTSQNIFKLITTTAVDLTNDTTSAIGDIGGSITGIFKSIGGVPSIILYIAVLAIIGYLTKKHISENGKITPPERKIIQHLVPGEQYLSAPSSHNMEFHELSTKKLPPTPRRKKKERTKSLVENETDTTSN